MLRVKKEWARRSILYILYKARSEDFEPPKPYRVEVEHRTLLSLEVQEILSFSAEKQSQVVNYLLFWRKDCVPT